MRRESGLKRPAARKNARRVYKQRKTLARLRVHLMDEVRNRAGQASHGRRLSWHPGL